MTPPETPLDLNALKKKNRVQASQDCIPGHPWKAFPRAKDFGLILINGLGCGQATASHVVSHKWGRGKCFLGVGSCDVLRCFFFSLDTLDSVLKHSRQGGWFLVGVNLPHDPLTLSDTDSVLLVSDVRLDLN